MEKIEIFENSNEFKQFKMIINKEIPLISSVFDNFKNEISRLVKLQSNV